MPKSSFDDIRENAYHTLQILGDQPIHRTAWTLLARTKVKISTNQFNYLLIYLLDHGYVERLERGVYKRTERGMKQLEIWNME